MTHGLDTSFLLAVQIVEHAHHADALRLLAEFVHVVTDERRFQQPGSTGGGGSSIANRCRDCAFPYLDAAPSTWAKARARRIARRDVPRSGRHVDSDFERDEFHGF